MIAENCDHLQRCSRRFAVRAGIAEWMTRRGYPRLAMAGALALSGLAGAAASVQLHRWGLSAMWLRYPVAFAAAYAVFVVALGRMALAVSRRLERYRKQVRGASNRHQIRSNPDDSRGFDELVRGLEEGMREQQADPRALPAYLTILLALTVALVCVYFIWMAPILLAELIAEGALIGWLYRPMWRGPRPHWLQVAIEQTGMPAVLVALSFAATGLGFQLYAPRAETAGEVWQQMLDRAAADRAQAMKLGRR